MTPFELVFGRLPRLPIDSIMRQNRPIYFLDANSYRDEVVKHFSLATKLVQENIRLAQRSYKHFYDRTQHNVDYNVGDLVLKESQIVKKGLAKKLMPLYEGPYRITKIRYPNITIQMLSNPSKIPIIHVNRSKRFLDNCQNPPLSDEQGHSIIANPGSITEDRQTTAGTSRYNLRSRPWTSDI